MDRMQDTPRKHSTTGDQDVPIAEEGYGIETVQPNGMDVVCSIHGFQKSGGRYL